MTERHDPAFEDNGPQFVICPDCGNEQADMGQNVSCDECGYGPMPTAPVQFNGVAAPGRKIA